MAYLALMSIARSYWRTAGIFSAASRSVCTDLRRLSRNSPLEPKRWKAVPPRGRVLRRKPRQCGGAFGITIGHAMVIIRSCGPLNGRISERCAERLLQPNPVNILQLETINQAVFHRALTQHAKKARRSSSCRQSPANTPRHFRSVTQSASCHSGIR